MEIKVIRCKVCDFDNYVDIDIVHQDPSNGEINEFMRHCTYCTSELIDVLFSIKVKEEK